MKMFLTLTALLAGSAIVSLAHAQTGVVRSTGGPLTDGTIRPPTAIIATAELPPGSPAPAPTPRTSVTPARQTNYWSLAHPNWPPLPALPSTNLPVKAYFLGTDTVNILIDDSSFRYSTNAENLSTNLHERPSRIFDPEPRLILLSTNAEDVEAVRQYLPFFEQAIPGSTRRDRLPPQLLVTNTVTPRPAFLPTNKPPHQMTPEEAAEFKRLHSTLPFLFLFPRRRRQGGTSSASPLRSSAGPARTFSVFFLLVLSTLLSGLHARADLVNVAGYTCEVWPLGCPGDNQNHLVGSNRTSINYWPNEAQVQYLTNGGQHALLRHGSPTILGPLRVGLNYSDLFAFSAIWPDACFVHPPGGTDYWNCATLDFSGWFNDDVAFSATNLLQMYPGKVAIAAEFRANAHENQNPKAQLQLLAIAYGNPGSYLWHPDASKLVGPPPQTRLQFNGPDGFDMRLHDSTNLFNWNFMTNFPMPAGGYAVVDIDDDTNSPPTARFFSISTTNTYTAAP